MERLRAVARTTGAGPAHLAYEAAGALAGLGHDPVAMVTACRRLVERHPAVGPMWWLASRVLCSPDPMEEAWRVATEIEADPTATALAAALPGDATVVLVGWPDVAAESVGRRGDVAVLVVSAGGESAGLVRRLRSAGSEAEDVPDAGLAAAVAGAGLVVVEASGAGPERFVAVAGSHAAAAVARAAGVPVWLVAGVGRTLPERLWAALEAGLDRSAAPAWHRTDEVVPLALCDVVVGPAGARPADEVPTDEDCPVAPELLRPPT